VRKTLKKLEKKDLLIKLSKYKFYKNYIKFLEYFILIKNLKLNSKKIKIIKN